MISARYILLPLLVALTLLLAGCSTPESRDRPDVKTLFRKALEESRVTGKDPAREIAREQNQADRDTSDAEKTSKKKVRQSFRRAMRWLGRRVKASFQSFFDLESPSEEGSDGVPGRKKLSGPPVTSSFTQTQVRQAIQVIANQADVNVIVGQQVQGVVTAQIQEEPFEQALQRLLLPLGLVYRKVNESRYYVGTSNPSSALFPRLAVSRSYRAKELDPTKLKELLSERYKKFVRVSEKQQILLIEAPVRIAHEIRRRLKKKDRPVPQVVLEAIVVVFSPDSRFRFGLDFSQGVRVEGDDFINVMMEDLNLSGQYGPPQFSAVRNFSFTSAFLEALAEEGYLTIRASPRVMARAGEKAKIRIGRQTFFSEIPGNVEDARFFNQEIRDVESGIELEMVPTIRGKEVLIDLQKAEVSEEIRTSQSATSVNTDFPVINRRTVSTMVQVQDRQTLVIGGLVQRNVVDQEAEVPGLAKIPLLGNLFYEVDRQTQQREVAVFLSPRIVNRGSE